MSRPTTFDQFIGQAAPVLQLKTLAAAALLRGSPPSHTLLTGPPGLGKTTLAYILAGAVGANLVETSGPALKSGPDLFAKVSELQPGGVLFVDEIHRLPAAVEELLYPVLEDGYMLLMLGKTGHRSETRYPCPPFCAVGATTLPSSLSAPLRRRFGLIVELEYYDAAALAEIACKYALQFDFELAPEAAAMLADAARGTPGHVINLVDRLRDFCAVRALPVGSEEAARGLYIQNGISRGGLNRSDRAILDVIGRVFAGGPAGINAIAATLAADAAAIAEVHEPHLLRLGLLARTQRGRVVTSEGLQYLKEIPCRPS
jgi:Holliday junction DNA helicase RuvB